MLEPKRWANPPAVSIPLIDLLDDIKKAGFSELEIWGYHIYSLKAKEIDSLVKKLKQLRISVPSIGSYVTSQTGDTDSEKILKCARKYFSLCKRFGSKRMRMFYGNKGFRESDGKYINFIDDVYDEIFTTGKKENVRVLIEMHSGTLADSIEGLNRAIEKWGDDFRVVFQQYGDNTENALKALDVVKGRIGSVHLQNHKNNVHTLLSEGDLDYRQVLPKLLSSGYTGPLVLEFTKNIVPAPGADFNYKNVLTNAAKDRDWITHLT